MQIFHCERCGHRAAFSAQQCTSCAAPLGYVGDERSIRVLTPTDNPAIYSANGDDQPLWRCLNAAWGCNWMLPAASATSWCRSCQMTRGRPDEARPEAIAAWMTAEAAKRRLVHQLDELALPIEIRSESVPDGLAFDLVDLPGEGGITGHSNGIVTLDLAETDDQHRDELKRQLGESFRTVIGHLRHEIGHYYWGRLVGQTDSISRFRELFGDERADYRESVERHYSGGNVDWDPAVHVSAYAASHPFEDFAESFAHYLHILDALDTASAHHLLAPDSAVVPVPVAFAHHEFDDILDAWRPINVAVNAIAESLGTPVVYPFEPAGVIVDKLAFVHRQVVAHVSRDQFYADH